MVQLLVYKLVKHMLSFKIKTNAIFVLIQGR